MYRGSEDMILPGWAELTFIGEGLNFYRGGEDKQSSKLKVAPQQILINFIKMEWKLGNEYGFSGF